MRPIHVLVVLLAAGAAFGGGYAVASSGDDGAKAGGAPAVVPVQVQTPAIAGHRQVRAVPSLAPAPVSHVAPPASSGTPAPTPAPSTGGGGGAGGIIQG